jgi:hypothetical protein
MKKHRVLLSLICFAVFTFLAVGSTGGDDEPTPPEGAAAPKEEIILKDEVAWKLAVIKTDNRNLPDTDPLVNLFVIHLDSLEVKTEQSRTEIGDMVVKAWQILQEEVNPDEDLLSVIKELDSSIPDDTEIKFNLAEIAAAYIVLRQNE